MILMGEELQTGYSCAHVCGIDVLEGILNKCLTVTMSLPFLPTPSFPTCLTPPHTTTPFPPDLLPHLPDVREMWEEPGGVCVPQGPLFLLNCRETPHVLKNTSTHTHTHISCGKYSGCVITSFLEMFDFIPAVSVQTSVTGYICLNFMQLADFQIGLEKWLGFVCHLKCMV